MSETKKNIKSGHSDSPEQQLKSQIEELSEALKRERADAINIRRRMEEEKSKLASFHKASIINSFLPVVDNFDRALKHVPANLADDAYIKGIEGIVKQFDEILVNLGVEKIPTLGHEFNPIFHDAVTVEGDEGDFEVISEELRAGYKINDQVIRPAMVKVKKVSEI